MWEHYAEHEEHEKRRRRQERELRQLADQLIALRDQELLHVLRMTFEVRRPNPEEDGLSRNRFFLGTANEEIVDEGDEHVGPRDWEIRAVAYVDHDKYPAGWDLGPSHGFCQFGRCATCATYVRSNVKQAVCPVCGGEVYLT